MADHITYNDPDNTASEVGAQIRIDYYNKKALVEAAKEMYFGKLANVESMPKNMGKTIKRFHYMPILDDRNINDQGLNASGVTSEFESTITVAPPDAEGTAGGGDWEKYFVGYHLTVDATAITDAKTQYINWVKQHFPLLYAAMAHANIAADYTLQATTGNEVDHVVTLDLETLAASNVYTLKFGDILLTSGVMDATPTVAELITSLTTGGTNVANYAAIGFVITAGDDALVCTWAAGGLITGEITLLRTTGAALTEDPTITTTGAETLYSLGYRTTLNTSINGAGNMYGSSKDVGTISDRLPTLTESGGRVNRVGMSRVVLEGTIEKFGFFDEYTKESMDFDSDPELESHLITESVKAANEITEDQLQIDLLNGAGVIRYTGDASATTELSGETGSTTALAYEDFIKLGIELDNNRCPKNTKIITGSRMVDTKVINAARYMYIGSELQTSLMQLTDYHSQKAFIPIAQYGAAGTIARGEIGSIGDFRIIVVPEMMKWAGEGAAETTANAGYYATDSAYDVFPMLVVGDGSFTTIGFQTDGKTVKFKTKHVKPESDISYSTADPFGEKGFYSIKWYYGCMILRSERIALIKTIAEF